MAGRLFLLFADAENRNILARNRIFRDRRNPIDIYNDKELYERYRFDRPSILHITDLLSNVLNTTRRSKGLLPVQQIMITLRYYATGTFQLVCGDDIQVDKSTASRAIWKVTNGLLRMKSQYLKFPTPQESDKVKSDFYKVANFPGVLGLIDGTHIRIQRPSENENEYINRKFYPSVNVMAICDSSCIFLNVIAKWPGSTHDAFVWSQSSINAQFENGRDDGFILGDSGYPCKPWLLTPFREPENNAQGRYNSAHR